MFYVATRLASLVLLASVVRAAISPTGVSDPSSVPKVHKTSVKTDFTTIFSAIYSFGSHKRPTRDLNERDTITPPPLFAETFGPTNGANNADGYMGYELLTTYDVNACAQSCNTRGYDNKGGPCIYFNIWQAVVNGTPSAVTCSMYNTFTDASTAVNTGQGNLQVSLSRGFSRFTNLADGSFQDYTCVVNSQHGCPYQPSNFWTRVYVEGYDFVLIDNFPAHSGTSSCLLFFNPPTSTSPAFGSTLTYTQPLNTIPGQTYIVSFFYTMNAFSSSPQAAGPLFSVFWNNEKVLDVLQVGTAVSFQFLNAQVEVTATGPNDTLFFKNSVGFPHAVYLDDIAVFQKWF